MGPSDLRTERTESECTHCPCPAARAQRADPAAREQSRPMGRVESPALRPPRAKSGDAEVHASPGGCSHLGELGLRAKNRSGRARDGYCGWGIFTTPKPVAEPCRPGNRGLRLLDRHARSKVAPAVCTRHAFTDVDHPVWYGGVALKAPQKRRDGSACESRWLISISRRKKPSNMETARPRRSCQYPRGHHGSPHA